MYKTEVYKAGELLTSISTLTSCLGCPHTLADKFELLVCVFCEDVVVKSWLYLGS